METLWMLVLERQVSIFVYQHHISFLFISQSEFL